MQGIAGDGLLDLRQQRLRVADEEIANMLTALEFGSQDLDRTADHRALHLDKASIKRHPAIHGREEPECSFPPYVCRLDCRAVLQDGQQR
jgi:hypothetical protein